MSIFYVTVTTKDYLVRAWALYRSFQRVAETGRFMIFCLDGESREALINLGFPKQDILMADDYVTKEVLDARSRMLFREYCMLFKSICVEAVFDSQKDVDWCVNIDADMMFFHDPACVFEREKNAKVLLTHHRYSPQMKKWGETAGWHNGGFMAFRKSQTARDVLRYWLSECLKRPPYNDRKNETFNQKIVDSFPNEFPDVVTIPDKGVNTGPWDIDNYTVGHDGNMLMLSDEPLYIYHYQGMRFHTFGLIDVYSGERKERPEVIRHIYRPYCHTLRRAQRELSGVLASCRGLYSPLFSDLSIIRWHLRRIVEGRSNLVVALW
tara:strand:- start:19837 stop:20805 length:969 start_codon:yes stop_codon:yes gene_type:complete